MQQRARRSQPQPLAQLRGQRGQLGEQGVKIGAPDIAPVDHPQRQHAVCRPVGHQADHLLRRTHRVQMHPGHRQGVNQRAPVSHAGKIGGQQQLGSQRAKPGVGRRVGVQPLDRQIQPQYRFVNLHPADAFGLERGQQAGVGVEQRRQQRQAVAAILAFSQPQQA